MKIKVGIVSAEPSGDLLGLQAIEALKTKFSEVECVGIGGGKLLEYGLSGDRKLIQVMGFIEPLLNLFKIVSFRNQLIKKFKQEEIDLFIGIDSPDFNFAIHEQLSKAGIKTAQLVCPSVWAWRPGRAKKFRFLDYMLCIFPFEVGYCSNVRKESFFVGHPLVGTEDDYVNNRREDIIALLPGSRSSEIRFNLPDMLKAFNCFNEENNFKAIIPAYDSSAQAQINAHIKHLDNVSCERSPSLEILSKSKAAVICSGTASFEALLAETPTVVVYKTNRFNYFLLDQFVNSDFIAIPNILANTKIFEEFIQDSFTPEAVSNELHKLINNFDQKAKELKELKRQLSKPDFQSFANKFFNDCRG